MEVELISRCQKRLSFWCYWSISDTKDLRYKYEIKKVCCFCHTKINRLLDVAQAESNDDKWRSSPIVKFKYSYLVSVYNNQDTEGSYLSGKGNDERGATNGERRTGNGKWKKMWNQELGTIVWERVHSGYPRHNFKMADDRERKRPGKRSLSQTAWTVDKVPWRILPPGYYFIKLILHFFFSWQCCSYQMPPEGCALFTKVHNWKTFWASNPS